MQIEIAEHERMSESGSSLLRLIQNNDTCRLDLLVRESIQNCLDAGDKVNRSVRVDFNIGSFNTEKVSSYFEDITARLNQRFPGIHSYISIKDTHTVGLTGPIRYTDIKEDRKFGNLLKLVYEISKPQEQSGSGGSWGLGKTVYFRIGIGLVIYYSRIKTEKGYESRLAGALVEDEMKENHLLPQHGNIQRGIAWWGQTDPKNKDGKHTVPVTDDEEIKEIINAFGIQPFEENETGTMIIIPFIDKERLLDETVPSGIEDETEYKIPYWCKNTIEDYLKIAFQRWYAPRLNNKEYHGQYLEVYINGRKLLKSEMAPIFQLIQVLYNATPENRTEFNGKPVTSKSVDLRSVFKVSSSKSSRSGLINYMKVTAADMKMEAPDNYPNPYYYINRLSSETMYNDPIITYTRKPGMIISYVTTGDWTDNIPKAAIGEYIVGIFVANSDNRLVESDITFEEYLRRSEKADHMAWDDWAINGKNPRIIARIKKGVRKKIRDDFPVITSGSDESKNLGLGKMLADILMPPAGFSYWDAARGGDSGPGGTGGTGASDGSAEGKENTNMTSHVKIKQTGNIYFDEQGVNIPIRLLFGKKNKVVIEMNVNSERGSISSKEWEKNIMTAFPVALKYFTVLSASKGKGKKVSQILEGPIRIKQNFCESGISVSTETSSLFNIPDKITIMTEEIDNIVIDAVITYKTDNVQGNIILKEES